MTRLSLQLDDAEALESFGQGGLLGPDANLVTASIFEKVATSVIVNMEQEAGVKVKKATPKKSPPQPPSKPEALHVAS